MNSFLLYTAQVAVSLVLFYSVYWFFFRKETFYSINRFYLISSVLLSLVIPTFNITLNSVTETQNFAVLLDTVTITPEDSTVVIQNNLNLFQGIWIAYLTGVFIFLMRFLFELFQIIRLISKSPTTRHKNFTLVNLRKKYAPFSFFGYVFIPEEHQFKKDVSKILDHELAHIRQNHSIDLMIIELLSIFQWFNPVVWMYRKSIKENHEFLADEALINRGYDIPDYQKALLDHALGIQLNGMTNNFNYSILKRRIIMMTKQKTKKKSLFKYLLMLPVVAAVLVAFACSSDLEEETTMENSSQQKTASGEVMISSDESSADEASVFKVVDKMPEFPGGKEKLFKYLQNNLTYPEKAKQEGIEGKVVVKFIVHKDGKIGDTEIIKGVRKDIDSEGLRVVKEMPNWTPGVHNGKKVNVEFALPINFTLN